MKGEWRGVFEPDERGEEEELFLAKNDMHAQEKARRIAINRRFELKEIWRITDEGRVYIPLH